MSNTLDSQGGGSIITAAVAIDRDKNSPHAVKWAVENLHLMDHNIILVHVKSTHSLSSQEAVPEGGRAPTKDELQQFFLPYRGFCARKGVRAKEIVLHDIDVPSALSHYIINNCISTVVLGNSNRSALTRAFKSLDVPTSVAKLVPDFCTVYVASKTKAVPIKSASRPPTPANRTSSRQPSQSSFASETPRSEELLNQGSWSTSSGGSSFEGNNGSRLSNERSSRDLIMASHNNRYTSSKIQSYQQPPMPFMNNVHLQAVRTQGGSPASSFSGSSDGSGPRSFQSADLTFENLDYLRRSDADNPRRSDADNPRRSDASISSLSSQAAGELEDEMRRLKMELRQTMEMYESACKEAITAKEKVKEINQWKHSEAQKLEECMQAQEATLALVEMEKQKCKAAIEAAQMSQRLAELEFQKRKLAEKKFLEASEENKKAIDALSRSDLRYRKYSITEIEIATDYFATSEKIGEGGYGPVYKALLDHTPVAIKVLRPDISQGQQQFQREVEVLSRMRHPNMVLLLGACPEYGCLVYEYMEKGSLEDALFCRDGSPPLSWRTRFRIAAEIATALLFLHLTKPDPLVHRDLKPANILLDRNYVSKIGDVGLSRLVPPTVADSVTQYHMTSAAGTFCYIDPEYQQTGLLGTKSDIYSLGVMLLQIITARPAMGLTYHVKNAIEHETFAEILDPKVTDWPVEDALSYARLALQCCELRRKDRPDLGSVLLPELVRLRDLGSDSESKAGSGDQISPISQESLSFSLESSTSQP